MSFLSFKPGTVFAFRSPLKFPTEDLDAFPWLNEMPRFYCVDRALNTGGMAIPYLAYPCDVGGRRIEGAPDIVLKFPKIDTERFTSRQQADRALHLEESGLIEWRHVRRRLLGCPHANPVIDIDDQWMGSKSYTVTCQLYLNNFLPLNDWLTERKVKETPVGYEWHGFGSVSGWLDTASMIAEALCQVHSKRVVHGDIWPPNVFVSTSAKPYVNFIDFGESSLFSPGTVQDQTDHAYRAPERSSSAKYVPTESVDVYSFGKLLLYLATGTERKIDRAHKGRDRRKIVRELMLKRQPGLVRENPGVLDVIARCVAFEPVDRPNMFSVRDDLRQLIRTQPRNAEEVTESIGRIATAYSSLGSESDLVMRALIDQKVHELEGLLESLNSDMVVVKGHRNHLVRGLSTLFSDLREGDSWTSATTPEVWQSRALGLDGRYRAATIEAIRRGASVRRAFVFSVEECGKEWCTAFRVALKEQSSCSVCVQLAEALASKTKDFSAHQNDDEQKVPSRKVHLLNCRRLVDVLMSSLDMIKTWELEKFIKSSDPTIEKILDANGLVIGLVPVATIAESCTVRRQNPVSLMYRCRDGLKEADRWLLVMTDVRHRNEEPDQPSHPQLISFRVYRSVADPDPDSGPTDRKLYMTALFKEQTTNITASLELILQCATAAMRIFDGDGV